MMTLYHEVAENPILSIILPVKRREGTAVTVPAVTFLCQENGKK
jgi:hypothetical protein